MSPLTESQIDADRRLMRIAQIIPTLDPRTGGPPMITLNLATALARTGHEVHLLSHETPDAQESIEQLLAATPDVGLVCFHRLPTPAGRVARFQGDDWRATLESLDGPTNIVHLHGVWESAILGGAWAARALGIPYMLTPHGMLDPWSLSQKKWKKRIALVLIYRRMLNGAAAIHALNPIERDLFAPLHLRTPVYVVPNGFNLDELHPLPEAGGFRAGCPGLAERRFFLFLARLHYKKGLDILAEGFAAYRRAGGGMDLVVAGPDDGAEADFRRRIGAAGLNDHVHVVGPLYGVDKRAALRDASCFVLPSRQEGFSIAITEALACGMPVIVTRDCHFPEVAEVEAGVTIDLDADQLAEAMHRIESDPEAAAAMGRRGRAMVTERFTWDAVAERMAEVYEQLTGSGQGADRVSARSGGET